MSVLPAEVLVERLSQAAHPVSDARHGLAQARWDRGRGFVQERRR